MYDEVEGETEDCSAPAEAHKKKPSGFAGFSQGQEDSDQGQEDSDQAELDENRRSPPTAPRTSSSPSESVEMNSPPPPDIIDLCEDNDDIHVKEERRERSLSPSVFTSKKILHKNSDNNFTEKYTNNVNGNEGDSVDTEKLSYDKTNVFKPHENIPDVKKWDVDEVYTYFLGITSPEYAQKFRDHQIDGDALLLIKRKDVIDRFTLKLGPALRLYSHIASLQCKHNNPILAWNEV